MNPTLDGEQVFGTACHVVLEPNPRAIQRDSYAGQNGYTTLDGGSRGGRFRVSGVIVAPDLATLFSYESALLGYADGQQHAFTDTQGRSWPYVIFSGVYRPHHEGPKATDFGWCLPYSLELESVA